MSLVTPGAGTFWPQGHNLTKFGRGPLGDAILNKIENATPELCVIYIQLEKSPRKRGNIS